VVSARAVARLIHRTRFGLVREIARLPERERRSAEPAEALLWRGPVLPVRPHQDPQGDPRQDQAAAGARASSAPAKALCPPAGECSEEERRKALSL